MQPIYTLNARSNVFLEVIRDYFKLSNPEVRREIQAMHQAVQDILANKGIDYSELKSALVPRADRIEAAFIFNSQSIESSCYGYEVFSELIPILDKRSNNSILCGDLIHDGQQFIFNVLDESMVLARSFEFVHGSSLFCVYFNNLTELMLKRLHEELISYEAYLGFIPAKYASKARIFLSTTLANSFLKRQSQIIMGHEDDRPNKENVNMVGYPFEENGYTCISLQSQYFDTFLSYKIERPVFPGFESDTEFAINAVTDNVQPLNDLTILIEDSKFEYLRSEKAGRMKKAGLFELHKNELAELIKAKIAANYIYNMVHLEDHDVIKFTLMIEVRWSEDELPTKITTALEYMPEKKIIRVITLY